MLRATPKEDINIEGYLEENFEKGEWYIFFQEDSVIYVKGRTHYHKIGFEKDEFEEKFTVKNFYNLYHINILESYKKLKTECVDHIMRHMYTNDITHINLRNLIGYLYIQIGNEDTQDFTDLLISKDDFSIYSADHWGKYVFKKNRVDSDIINIIMKGIDKFELLIKSWDKWFEIYEKYYDNMHVYDTEGDIENH